MLTAELVPDLLSVLTASFNYRRYIEDTLQSVQALGGRVQHVVVDDESTDGSREYLRSWDSQITYLEQQNAGLAEALNTALERASGEWVGWLNADDFYLPWVSEALDSITDERVDVLYGDTVFVDASGRFLRLAPQHPYSLSVLRRYGPYIYPPSFFVRRAMLGARAWNTSTVKLMDLDLYLTLAARKARFLYIAKPLGVMRRHPLQESYKPTPKDETLALQRRHGLPTDPRLARMARWRGGVQHAALKLGSGGYIRQFRSRSMVGASMMWWNDPSGSSNVDRLARVY